MGKSKMKDQLLHFRKPVFEALETRRLLDASNSNPSLVESISELAPAQTVSNKWMQFKIELIDMQGKPIEKIYVDDEFLLQVFVKDLRDLPRDEVGIFTAFTILRLDHLLERTGEGRVGSAFFTLKDMDPSRMEIGGMSNTLEPNGTDPLLLFEVPVRAIADGETTISTAPIEGYRGSVMLPMLQYGVSELTPTTAIDFASLPVTVLRKSSIAPIESVPTVITPVKPPDSAIEQPTEQPNERPIEQPAERPTEEPTERPIDQSTEQPVLVAGPFLSTGDNEEAIESEESSWESENDMVERDYLINGSPEEVFLISRPSYSSFVLGSSNQSSSKLEPKLADFILPANKSNLSVKRSQSFKPSAVEVVDAILYRLQASDFTPIRFDWENNFARAPLSRLPLNHITMPRTYSSDQYGGDGFAEVDQYFGFIQTQLPLTQSVAGSANEDMAFQRAPLSILSLLVPNGNQPTSFPELKSDMNSAVVDLVEPSESNSDVQDSRLIWLNQFIVGLVSLFVVLDRRPTRRQTKSLVSS